MGDGVSRNDPCPCGSGKKYKQCHLGKELPTATSKRRAIVPIVLSLIGVGAGVAVAITSDWTTGLAIGVGSIIGVGSFVALRSPPPVRTDSGDPAGLNFGR